MKLFRPLGSVTLVVAHTQWTAVCCGSWEEISRVHHRFFPDISLIVLPDATDPRDAVLLIWEHATGDQELMVINYVEQSIRRANQP